MCGERRNVGVKRALPKEASLDVSGGGVVCVWDNGGELFSECCGYFCVVSECFAGKRYGLVRWSVGAFAS